MVDAIFNGLLVGSSSYALSLVKPDENPFIFTACAVGLCHGLLGLYGNIVEGNPNTQDANEASHSIAQKIHSLTHSCVDIVMVPLINIDLYMKSQQSATLAMGHGMFIIPLAFELTLKTFNMETEGSSTETLKELTTLGNIVSLIFLSVNEGHLPYGIMALTALLAQHGSLMSESMLKGTGENMWLMGYSAFMALVPTALSSVGETRAGA